MFDNFARYEYLITSSLCVLALGGMGTTLSTQAFREVARRPRCIVFIALGQLIIGPLTAIALSLIFDLPPGIVVGLLLVTALPGGLFSNVFALLSRSHVALSISATAVCTLGAIVTTPLVLSVFGGSMLPRQLRMPLGHILFEIVVCLLIPLAAGMLLQRLKPAWAGPIGKLCVRGATLLLVVYVVGAVQSGRLDFAAHPWQTHVAIILLSQFPILVCGLLSWPFQITALELFTCQMEVAIRNVHLGLLLSVSLFPAAADARIASDILFVLLYYGGAGLGTGIVMTAVRLTELRIMGDRHRALPPPEVLQWFESKN